MTNEEFRKHSEVEIDKRIAELMIHFDTVQIFVTRVDDGITMGAARGNGNWYARVGHVSCWVERMIGDDAADEVEE